MNGYGAIVLFILAIMFGPPLLLTVIGITKQKDNPNAAKQLYIIAFVYVLIGGGICASMMM